MSQIQLQLVSREATLNHQPVRKRTFKFAHQPLNSDLPRAAALAFRPAQGRTTLLSRVLQQLSPRGNNGVQKTPGDTSPLPSEKKLNPIKAFTLEIPGFKDLDEEDDDEGYYSTHKSHVMGLSSTNRIILNKFRKGSTTVLPSLQKPEVNYIQLKKIEHLLRTKARSKSVNKEDVFHGETALGYCEDEGSPERRVVLIDKDVSLPSIAHNESQASIDKKQSSMSIPDYVEVPKKRHASVKRVQVKFRNKYIQIKRENQKGMLVGISKTPALGTEVPAHLNGQSSYEQLV